MKKYVLLLFLLILVLVPVSAWAKTYATSFATAENPISESSNWTNGYTDGGGLWHNVKTTGGNAIGTQVAPFGYDDSTAILTGTWGATQTVQGTVYLSGAPGGTPEVELRLRSTLNATTNSGYEVLFSVINGATYHQIVRWDGAYNDWHYLTLSPGNCGDITGLVNGNRVKATISGSTITTYIDTGSGFVQQCTATDSTFTSGNPGIGFFASDTTDQTKFGFSDFMATDSDEIVLCSGDITNALSSAFAAANYSGATIVIGPGTCTISSTVTWNAPAIATLKGSGTTAHGGGDLTVITDTISGDVATFDIRMPASGSLEISGLTIKPTSGSVRTSKGLLYLLGNGTSEAQVYIHHITLDAKTGATKIHTILPIDVIGVLSDSIILMHSTGAIIPWRTGTDGNGNSIWAKDAGFGTNDFFFVEDCTFTGTNASYDSRMADLFVAGKMVMRFNTLVDSCGYEVHATGAFGNGRGSRAAEYYGNTHSDTDNSNQPNRMIAHLGGGSAIVWGNNADNVFITGYLLSIERDGAHHVQSATPTGWGYCGTNYNGTGSNWDGGTVLGTDLVYGYPCIDQPGRGKSDLLTGLNPDNKINARTGTLYWPGNVLEPMYIWNNADDFIPGWGGSGFFGGDTTRVQADRDYYYDGTNSGVRTGTTLPASCSVNQGFWKTNEGSWNQSTTNPYGVQQNGADGVLYKCTATNTWTAYYTPYTYPHPLRGAGTTPPSAQGCTMSGTSFR